MRKFTHDMFHIGKCAHEEGSFIEIKHFHFAPALTESLPSLSPAGSFRRTRCRGQRFPRQALDPLLDQIAKLRKGLRVRAPLADWMRLCTSA